MDLAIHERQILAACVGLLRLGKLCDTGDPAGRRKGAAPLKQSSAA